MKSKRIIVPINFDGKSKIALDFAGKLAKQINGKLVLYHLIHEPGTASFNSMGQVSRSAPYTNKDVFLLKYTQNMKVKLDAYARKSGCANLIEKTYVDIQPPGRDLGNALKEQMADYVVVGVDDSQSDVEKFLFGSKINDLLTSMDIPLISVQKKFQFDKIRNVIIASEFEDFSTIDERISDFIHNVRAKAHLVRINTPLNFKNQKEVHQNMVKYVANAKLNSYDFHAYDNQNLDDGIHEVIQKIKPDLLIMTTPDLNALERFFLRSKVTDVVETVNLPILTFNEVLERA
ncbi:MAG: universal stress protein [Flavobacteriales bacterium]|nr:universal stress protein [Flavobacteriales bacterium]